jgi:hypothetical protein
MVRKVKEENDAIKSADGSVAKDGKPGRRREVRPWRFRVSFWRYDGRFVFAKTDSQGVVNPGWSGIRLGANPYWTNCCASTGREGPMTEHEQILYWISDCEAATLEYLAGLKSPSRSELRRHRDICKSLHQMLVTGHFMERSPVRKETVIQKRLKTAVERAIRVEESKQKRALKA